MRTSRIAAIAAASLALAATAGPATAKPGLFSGTGCNGVWNIFVWGCAPWDNNNGPKYPYYNKHSVTVTGKLIDEKGNKLIQTADGQKFPLVSQTGSGLVASGGGNFSGLGWSQ